MRILSGHPDADLSPSITLRRRARLLDGAYRDPEITDSRRMFYESKAWKDKEKKR